MRIFLIFLTTQARESLGPLYDKFIRQIEIIYNKELTEPVNLALPIQNIISPITENKCFLLPLIDTIWMYFKHG